MGAGARKAERSSCRFVLTRPPFSGHTRTAAQNRESQRLKMTRHAINARAFCHGQRPMVVNVEKTRQMRRVLSKAPLPNTYARRATAHRGAKQTIARRKG